MKQYCVYSASKHPDNLRFCGALNSIEFWQNYHEKFYECNPKYFIYLVKCSSILMQLFKIFDFSEKSNYFEQHLKKPFVVVAQENSFLFALGYLNRKCSCILKMLCNFFVWFIIFGLWSRNMRRLVCEFCAEFGRVRLAS